MQTPTPPRWADQLLEWLCAPHLLEEVQGDLHERFLKNVRVFGVEIAHREYIKGVLGFIRPFALKREARLSPTLNLQIMISNYFKIAFRNLLKYKGYSFINIFGLASGMAVAMLIGLWIYDELSFNKHFRNYGRIAKVMQGATSNGGFGAGEHQPIALGTTLKTDFAEDFKYVIMSSWNGEHILAYGDKKFTKTGNYLSSEAPDMLTLNMLKGSRAGLADQNSVLLSESTSKALFGYADPMGKIIKIDNKLNVKVTGVYEDIPYNTEYRDLSFIAPWDLYVSSESWIKNNAGWDNNSWQILVQIAPKADFEAVSKKIKNLRLKNAPETAYMNPEVFLHPMSRWHLYGGWDKLRNPEGRIQYVWLFGIIGLFVLLLACINFMNLSTARSEKRAKEVGIRKAVGSVRAQLIMQFFAESFLMAALAFGLSLFIVLIMLPFFNEIADKKLSLPWSVPIFWIASLGFSLITGLIAGSYPALYLSSFQPVKVLKGTFRAGRLASIPRKVLVVTQFSVSIILIISTIVVFRQIQHAKNRPIGYDRNGIITVSMNTPELRSQYSVIRNELIKTGAASEMSTSSSPTTKLGSRLIGFEWENKDPGFKEQFGVMAVTHDFGKTVNWQFIGGRDFSRAFSTDSSGMILNETAVKYMGLKDPVGKIIRWDSRPYQILGVIKDIVMGSPFEPVYQTIFILDYNWAGVINIKLNPELSAGESLTRVEKVFRKFNPASPFDYKFIDQQYALKFSNEERIGKLATFFAILAILISCLGLFGLASFVAEQRIKEIGIRKVLGASVLSLWGLLSKEFILFVLTSFLIAVPVSAYLMNDWLQKYDYRTEISWWVFVLTGVGTLFITLMTVSYQAIKAALMNPVKTLKNE